MEAHGGTVEIGEASGGGGVVLLVFDAKPFASLDRA